MTFPISNTFSDLYHSSQPSGEFNVCAWYGQDSRLSSCPRKRSDWLPDRLRGDAWHWTLSSRSTVRNVWEEAFIPRLFLDLHTASNTYGAREELASTYIYANHRRFLRQ